MTSFVFFSYFCLDLDFLPSVHTPLLVTPFQPEVCTLNLDWSPWKPPDSHGLLHPSISPAAMCEWHSE